VQSVTAARHMQEELEYPICVFSTTGSAKTQVKAVSNNYRLLQDNNFKKVFLFAKKIS